MSYEYNKPRRINVVSIFLLLLVLAAGYAAYKFIPVYWQGRKIDEALDEIKLPAARFYRLNDEVRRTEADQIIANSLAKLHEMGIEDTPEQPVQVWFSPDYKTLNARYQVIVVHPAVLKPTVMTMERVREIPDGNVNKD